MINIDTLTREEALLLTIGEVHCGHFRNGRGDVIYCDVQRVADCHYTGHPQVYYEVRGFPTVGGTIRI